jgi:hypothetical protein
LRFTGTKVHILTLNVCKKTFEGITVIRELYCCGSGKGGVMQNQGKNNEFIPRLMPFMEVLCSLALLGQKYK